MVPFVLLSGSIKAGDPENYLSLSLCNDDETIYISCALGVDNSPSYDGRVASICAKGNYSPGEGYVQYRYGRSLQSLEIEFPENKTPPIKVFRLYEYDPMNPIPLEGIREALRFTSGNYIYSFEDHGFSGYRLVVREGGKEVFNENCDDPGHAYISDKAYLGLEVIRFGAQEVPE